MDIHLSPSAWVDLHCHILPGIDDGARDLPQAVAMARRAWEDGIGIIVATPHDGDLPAGDRRQVILEHVDRLNAALQAAGIALTVLPGMEVQIAPDICRQVERGGAIPLAGSRYILLELPYAAYPLYTDQIVFDLQLMGMGVLLAHPERNARLSTQPELLRPLVERGVLAQLTAGSVLGHFGAETQRAAQYMLRHGLAHVLASDAHDDAGRPPTLSEAVLLVGDWVGQGPARSLAGDLPRALLNDEAIELADVPAPRRTSVWDRLWPARRR